MGGRGRGGGEEGGRTKGDEEEGTQKCFSCLFVLLTTRIYPKLAITTGKLILNTTIIIIYILIETIFAVHLFQEKYPALTPLHHFKCSPKHPTRRSNPTYSKHISLSSTFPICHFSFWHPTATDYHGTSLKKQYAFLFCLLSKSNIQWISPSPSPVPPPTPNTPLQPASRREKVNMPTNYLPCMHQPYPYHHPSPTLQPHDPLHPSASPSEQAIPSVGTRTHPRSRSKHRAQPNASALAKKRNTIPLMYAADPVGMWQRSCRLCGI